MITIIWPPFVYCYNFIMKNILFTLLFCITTVFNCFSQAEVYIGDVSGPPMKEKQYTNVEGSPYFINQWEKGIVSLTNGKQYSGLLLKYDEYAGELNFRYGTGEPMKFVESINFFIINHYDTTSRNHIQYKFISLYIDNKKDFLQSYSWSDKDELKFLVKRKANMYTTQVYNSATKISTFEKNYTYFMQKGNIITKIKLNEKELFSYLPLKSDEEKLKKYIKEKKLKISKEEDFSKAISYINSIYMKQ